MTTKAEDLCADARRNLAALDRLPSDMSRFDMQAGLVVNFLADLRALAALGSDPAVIREMSSLAADTAPLLVTHEEALATWLRRMHQYSLQGREEGFLRVCKDRSGFEIAREVYRGTVAEPILEGFDIAELDETLHELAQEYGLTEIPPGIPASHRWWLWTPKES
jgi:hypothetical protein